MHHYGSYFVARRTESPNDVTTSYATASRCVNTVPFSWRDGQNHQMMWPPAMQQHPGASLRKFYIYSDVPHTHTLASWNRRGSLDCWCSCAHRVPIGPFVVEYRQLWSCQRHHVYDISWFNSLQQHIVSFCCCFPWVLLFVGLPILSIEIGVLHKGKMEHKDLKEMLSHWGCTDLFKQWPAALGHLFLAFLFQTLQSLVQTANLFWRVMKQKISGPLGSSGCKGFTAWGKMSDDHNTSDQSLDAGRKAWKHPGSIIPGSGQWCKPVVTVVELCSAVCHPCGVLDVASLSSGNMRRAIWLWNEDVCAEALGENELEVEIPKCNGKQLLCWMRLEELTIYWRLQMFSSSFIPFANLQSSKTSLERQGGWQFLFKV